MEAAEGNEEEEPTAAEDSAAMQKYLDKLRYMLNQPPPATDDAYEAPVVAFDPSWGFYGADRRFNRDQVGLQVDFKSEPNAGTQH